MQAILAKGAVDVSSSIPNLGESGKIEALCIALAAARDQRDELKGRLADVEEEFDRLEAELASHLHDAGLESVRYDRWVLSLKAVVSWKVPESAREEIVRLLKINVPELVKESVNSMSLNGYLRKQESQLEGERPEWWHQFKLLVPRQEELSLGMRKR